MLLLLLVLAIPSAAAQCIPPPPGSCPQRHEQFICHVEGLWLVNGQFYALDLQAFPLPYTVPEHHTGRSITILRAPYVLHATEIWKGGLTVIHHRIYPHAYAHMMRDTLPQDLFAFRRFHTATWDPAVIRPQLRALYLDGETTTHEGYRVHSDHPPWERTVESLQGTSMYFERAVVGHFGELPVDSCNHHFFSPADWQGYSDFLALATLGRLPGRNPLAVWLANRNPGADRELVNGDDLARALPGDVMTDRPGTLARWKDQILLARTAAVIVGPHGANLANVVAAGTNVSVVEIQVREFLSGWYAQQCGYQGARWFSSHTRVEDVPAGEGGGRVSADVELVATRVRAAMLGREAPVCAFEFTAAVQMCW
jgi:hypothetical protein